ncbi:hypothetical protein FOPE_10806 [Fonsecaea pedrosoi]|nr:hypothetical protein FOPE_10806 [Fonsecaea pedrosoi]
MRILKPVRTSNPESSIWKGLPEDAFRRTVIALSKFTDGVPAEPKSWWLAAADRDSPSSSTTCQSLPYHTERQLADDFAFISAAQEGVESVAAVCIEELREPPGLIFRVAANDGIGEEDRTVLRQICDSLMSCASNGRHKIHLVEAHCVAVLTFQKTFRLQTVFQRPEG